MMGLTVLLGFVLVLLWFNNSIEKTHFCSTKAKIYLAPHFCFYANFFKNYLTQNSFHFIETVLGHKDNYYTFMSTQFLDIT
jgi:hypothetical protein